MHIGARQSKSYKRRFPPLPLQLHRKRSLLSYLLLLRLLHLLWRARLLRLWRLHLSVLLRSVRCSSLGLPLPLLRRLALLAIFRLLRALLRLALLRLLLPVEFVRLLRVDRRAVRLSLRVFPLRKRRNAILDRMYDLVVLVSVFRSG